MDTTKTRRVDLSNGSIHVTGIIVHDGKEYASGVGSVDVDAGRIFAYWTPVKGKTVGTVDRDGTFFDVTLWDGTVIARAYIVNSWYNYTPYAYDYRQKRYAITFAYGGYNWNGIGHGPEMYLRAKKGRKLDAIPTRAR
jgi:hypothetical protein